jgi:hypothetical protein
MRVFRGKDFLAVCYPDLKAALAFVCCHELIHFDGSHGDGLMMTEAVSLASSSFLYSLYSTSLCNGLRPCLVVFLQNSYRSIFICIC